MTALTVLLSACQADYFEPGASPAVEQEGQPLVLKVTDSGLPTHGSPKSRTIYEYDGYHRTHFENGDKVGIFAIDSEGNIMADNVPYIYINNEDEDEDEDEDEGEGEDEGVWMYDESEKDPRKHRIFYDAEMTSYIIYYPYTAEVDGISSLKKLKEHEVFACRRDQSDKEAFRFSDLMVSVINVDEIEKKHEVCAALCHVRNCLMFDIDTSWEIPGQGDLIYKTPLEALDNFFFYNSTDGEDNHTVDIDDPYYPDGLDSPWADDTVDDRIPIEYAYKFDDGCYRYILPDTFEGTLRWNYTYHRQTYVDEWQVSRPEEVSESGCIWINSKCYFYQALHAMGAPIAEKMQPGDLYCVHDDNREVGFPLPWETRELLDENRIRCIGMIVSVGRNPWDDNEYPAFGEAEENQVNGYVLSLTYLHNMLDQNNDGSFWWGVPSEWLDAYSNTKLMAQYKINVLTYCPRFMDKPSGGYWNAYTVNQEVHNRLSENPDYEPYYRDSIFDKITRYGEEETDQNQDQAWDDYLAAPENCSGWLVPSRAFLEDNNDFIQGIYRERILILRKIISDWQQARESASGNEENEANIQMDYPYCNNILLDGTSTKDITHTWWTCTEWYGNTSGTLYPARGYATYYVFSKSVTFREISTRKSVKKVVRPALVF